MVLKDLWVQLQGHLLVKRENTVRMMTRKVPPTSETLDNIVTLMFSFDALMPVFKHLLSARGAAKALVDTGALLLRSFTSFC